jgi:hypothetical protein
MLGATSQKPLDSRIGFDLIQHSDWMGASLDDETLLD